MKAEFHLDAESIQPLLPLLDAVAIAAAAKVQAAAETQRDHNLAHGEPEAAALLGISKWTLRELRLAGEVRASKLGRRTVYPRDELLRLLAQKQE